MLGFFSLSQIHYENIFQFYKIISFCIHTIDTHAETTVITVTLYPYGWDTHSHFTLAITDLWPATSNKSAVEFLPFLPSDFLQSVSSLQLATCGFLVLNIPKISYFINRQFLVANSIKGRLPVTSFQGKISRCITRQRQEIKVANHWSPFASQWLLMQSCCVYHGP